MTEERKHTRLLAVLLALAVLLGLTALPVSAADTVEGTCGENLRWSLTGTTLTISGSGPMEDWSYDNECPWAIYSPAIVHVVVEDGVTSIGSGAFDGCSVLLDVSLPDTITAIGSDAFEYCSSLTELTIPAAVTEIGDYAFYSCEMLSAVTIPQGVTAIADDTFGSCAHLEQIELPDGVASIGDSAFSDCTALETVTIPAAVTEIGDAPFSGCTRLREILVAEGNSSYTSLDGVLYDNAMTTLIQAPGTLNALSIPAGIEVIGERALAGCTQLTEIVVPEGVTSIGYGAFSGCSNVTYIVLPASLQQAGYGVLDFTGWSYYGMSLSDVYFGGDEAAWAALQEDPFAGSTQEEPVTDVTIHYQSTGPEPEETTPDELVQTSASESAAPTQTLEPALEQSPSPEASGAGSSVTTILVVVIAVLLAAAVVLSVVLIVKKARKEHETANR